jgi:hypothetical protein
MTVPRYARFASTLLSRIGAAAPPTPDPNDRAQTIAAIARAIEASRRQRQARRWGMACAAAGVVVLAALGGYRLASRGAPVMVAIAPAASPVAQIVAHPMNGGSSVVVLGAQAPLDDGRLLGPGSRVVTPANGRAMLSFSTGSTVLLREGTDMTVAAEGTIQRLHLDSGSVELHVAKLASDHRFIVDTPDSEVEVRGTRFSVSIVAPDPGCGAAVRTRVAVTEGVVVVRHAGAEDRVAVGEEWPAGCLHAPAVSVTAGPRPPIASPVVGASSPGSTLTDQNDLFAAAASAKRHGDARGALAALDRLLATYPASPLVESALVERMRILQTQSHDRSRVAAKEYLARYPNGFAQSEAEAIVAESP